MGTSASILIKMSKKLVLSISGGMDSVVLLHMAVDKGYDEINLITFNYGQRHIREIDCIQDQIDAVKAKDPNISIDHYVADVGFIKYLAPTSSLTNTDIDNPDVSKMAGDAQPVSYVPFRNQLFNTIGCAYAEAKGADTVWYGAAEVDSLAGYWDGSQVFVDAMNNLTALNRENRIKIEAPLLTMSKEAIVEEGVRLKVDFSKTWTCYSNRKDGLADATTPSSSMRVKGFVDAGYQDPIQYVQQDKLSEVYMAKGCKKI
jgi:7-cyano-7-deazaguanine synthase